MPIKQRKLYELPKGEEEQKEASAKYGVKIDEFATPNEFHNKDITMNGGKKYGEGQCSAKVNDMWEESTKIEGLYCPDCDSQAFKTDQKNVAVCGDYPGWYFFYRRLDHDIEGKAKVKMVVNANGEMEYITDEGTDVTKDV